LRRWRLWFLALMTATQLTDLSLRNTPEIQMKIDKVFFPQECNMRPDAILLLKAIFCALRRDAIFGRACFRRGPHQADLSSNSVRSKDTFISSKLPPDPPPPKHVRSQCGRKCFAPAR